MTLQRRGDVRALQGSMGLELDSERQRLAAASFLYQLAQEVREGNVDGFEVGWAGNDVVATWEQRK